MKVNFNLRATKPTDKPQPINAVIRWNNQRLVYSTSFKVRPENWDNKKQRAKITTKEPNFDKINSFLSKFYDVVIAYGADQRAKVETVHVEDLKTYLDSIYAPKEKIKEVVEDKTLFTFIDSFIRSRKEHPKLSKSVNKFTQMESHLRAFAAEKKRLIDFEHINLDFFDDFLKYLFAQNLRQNTCQKMIATLKTILNNATERNLNTNTAYKSRKFNTPTELVQNVYLDLKELDTLLNFDLSNESRLDRVRDLFLIGCFTGLRFSDFTNIKPENIVNIGGNENIKINTKKTGVEVVIPMHHIVKSILTKYGGNIPSPVSNQKMNDYLKELCKMVGFNQYIMVTHTVGGIQKTLPYAKCNLITTHTARRSYATNMFISGVPVLQIMRITGHTSDSSFKKYIKIDNEQNAKLLLEYDFYGGTEKGVKLKKVS
jgi:site-specific recombinase XerD